MSNSRGGHRRIASHSFFGFNFSEQDKFLSEIRLEAKKQKADFDSHNIKAIFQSYLNTQHFFSLDQLSQSASAALEEASDLRPGPDTVQTSINLMMKIKAWIFEMGRLTDGKLSYPELDTWLTGNISRAPSPFHPDDLKRVIQPEDLQPKRQSKEKTPVLRVNSSPELHGRHINLQDGHFEPLSLDHTEIDLECLDSEDEKDTMAPLVPLPQIETLNRKTSSVNTSNIDHIYQRLQQVIQPERFEKEEKKTKETKKSLERANSSPELRGISFNSQRFMALKQDSQNARIKQEKLEELRQKMERAIEKFKL